MTARGQAPKHNILVICDSLIVSGGLLRFVRLARELEQQGHCVFFLPLGNNNHDPRWFSPERVVDRGQAEAGRWDMTMVPGAGFPDAIIDLFSQFRTPIFGRRVQHVLNDPSRLEGFLRVNDAFHPEIVIFNNRHWPPGSFTRFTARKFVVVEGAVDAGYFGLWRDCGHQAMGASIVLGALANKNLGTVLDALETLPSKFSLMLIGRPRTEDLVRLQHFKDSGRVIEKGMVDEAGLREFYRSVDIVVHAELFAGWANLGAEAMACGVPVVCSRHGTLAFAEHEVTALVLDEVTGDAIAEQVLRLAGDAALRRRLVAAGRSRIEWYDWKRYASTLIECCQDDGRDHYTYAPELGLYGKWPLATRIAGLASVFESAQGKSVLDLACAEGVVAQELLKRGARVVHGFELEPSRVSTAKEMCASYGAGRSLFREADLSDWNRFFESHGGVLLKTYDVVLHLGLQHHLPHPKRIEVLRKVAALACDTLVIRTPERVYRDDNIEQIIGEAGLVLSAHLPDDEKSGTGGGLRIFVREKLPKDDSD